MEKVIKKFNHRPGCHCGSTALANLAGFHGHKLSEAMCFGLGSGLGFFFYKDERISPSRMLNGRTIFLEPAFFKNIGVEFQWREGDIFPWKEMKEWVDRDIPVIILTDLYHLDYYDTNTHFTGHAVVLAGYREREGGALLADTEREGLQRTSLESLALAMSSGAQPYPLRNYWREIPYFEISELPSAIWIALVENGRAMLNPFSDWVGLPAMELFSRDLATWVDAGDWQWCARFAYQVIEKRGTGGSGFRNLYAAYLKEAEKLLPALGEMCAGQRMEEVARKWTQLAALFYEISVNGPGNFPRAAKLAAEIAALEKSFFIDISQLPPPVAR
ncbi:MAG: BtrH N-terminal domain-containing protein [Bacillota bacterium]